MPGGTGTGRPLSLLPILDTLQVMVVVAQGADGAAAGRQTLRRAWPDPPLPAPQCKTAAWRARPAAAPVGTPSPFATVAADQPGTGETV